VSRSLLPDTHAFLWYATGHPAMSQTARELAFEPRPQGVEPARGVGPGERRLLALHQRDREPVGELGEQGVAVAEVVVDERLAHPRRAGHRLQRHLCGAELPGALGRGGENAFRGVAAGARARGGHGPTKRA
jgi:hypothetical protein